MLGKAKCKILKEIRQKIADENDIPYVTRECTYQGDCSGTCPRCESELRYLERELEVRQRIGKQVAVTALCAGISLSTTGCIDNSQELGGATQLAPGSYTDGNTTDGTELSGDVAIAPTEDDAELDGDVTINLPEDGTELAGDVEICLPEDETEMDGNELISAPVDISVLEGGAPMEPEDDQDSSFIAILYPFSAADTTTATIPSGEIIKTSEYAFDGLTAFADTSNTNPSPDAVSHYPVYTPKEDVHLSAVTTRHWNEGQGTGTGALFIADISDDTVKTLGQWTATVRDENGVENVYWDFFPDIPLQAGHKYLIMDSEPSTWNDYETIGKLGFVELFTEDGAEITGDFTAWNGHCYE